MATAAPSRIPFPLSTFPGANPQESSGRLVNCYSEPLGDPQLASGPAPNVWRRSPGLSLLGSTAETATYRGGLIVNNLSFEVWSNVYTVTSAGIISQLGSLPGSKKVTIARNQDGAGADVVVVDPDNGAFLVQVAGVAQAPASYNGEGILPQPNSVSFQDGYFFYTIATCQIYASPLNSVGAISALTFATAEAKSDVTLLRGIPFNGLMWFFTTGHCEIWQDVANAAPNFPYGRLAILEKGLVQQNAIAGFETGFSELIWAAQDFAVYWATPGTVLPTKISPPDLDRLIEAQVRAGNTLEASCYAFAGKKFWCLSSPAWSWEFCLNTQKWNERWSLQTTGTFGRWRATGGHPAFGKWLMGDEQSGNLLWIDNTNYTENGAVQLMRLESGPVRDFPNQIRIARADFDFDFGTGMVVGTVSSPVVGATAGTNGVVRLQLMETTGMNTGDILNVSGITGTLEANGSFNGTVIDATHVELQGTVFVNAYVGGGVVVDVTAPPNAVSPQVAISLSKDGGVHWGNPLVRSIGQQSKTLRQRATVKSLGLSGPMGCRWRLDISDPVYTGFFGGTQSSDHREIGT